MRRLIASALRAAAPTMEELARRIGLTSAALRQYRLGLRTPSPEVTGRLARVLREQASRLVAIARRLEGSHHTRGGDNDA
jgi:transcriptional regulator with XRE-family HTH domain